MESIKSKNALLKDPSAWELLRSKGYLLIDAGLEREVDLIREYIVKNFTLPNDRFYYSLLSNDVVQNKYLRMVFRNLLSPLYEGYFQQHRTLTESFLAKPANTLSELQLHQDWCYTDEVRFDAFNVWVPLMDVDADNGALFFLPGSHNWFRNYRSGSYPTARLGLEEIGGEAIETITMRRGQVLVFNAAVFHGSHPNYSHDNRIVATATLMDQTAPFLYYDKESDDKANVYEISDDTFIENLGSLAQGGMPFGNKIDTVQYIHAIPTPDALKRFML